MTHSYGPFDAGAGSSMTENNWRKMAQMFAETGVLDGYLNELAVFGDSTGMQVKVPSGLAYVKGHFFESDAQETVTIAANASGNPRIDRVVLEANFSTNVIDFVVVAGTPAGSPAAPSLTQDLTTKWQMPLAQVAVANGASTITAGNVTDDRNVFSPGGPVPVADSVNTLETLTTSAYTDLATPGPDVTVDVVSAALVVITSTINVTTTGNHYGGVSVTLSGANTQAAGSVGRQQLLNNPLAAGMQLQLIYSVAFLIENLDPGSTTFTLKYFTDSSASFSNRHLVVYPF